MDSPAASCSCQWLTGLLCRTGVQQKRALSSCVQDPRRPDSAILFLISSSAAGNVVSAPAGRASPGECSAERVGDFARHGLRAGDLRIGACAGASCRCGSARRARGRGRSGSATACWSHDACSLRSGVAPAAEGLPACRRPYWRHLDMTREFAPQPQDPWEMAASPNLEVLL